MDLHGREDWNGPSYPKTLVLGIQGGEIYVAEDCKRFVQSHMHPASFHNLFVTEGDFARCRSHRNICYIRALAKVTITWQYSSSRARSVTPRQMTPSASNIASTYRIQQRPLQDYGFCSLGIFSERSLPSLVRLEVRLERYPRVRWLVGIK